MAAINAGAQPELDEALRRVVASGSFILGAELEAFEHEWPSSSGPWAAWALATAWTP